MLHNVLKLRQIQYYFKLLNIQYTGWLICMLNASVFKM